MLFGRDAELAALSAAVREHRIVVVSGPPGIGKSALAGAFDRQETIRCGLVDAKDADDAMRVIARTLDIPIAPSATEEDVVARIGRAIGHRGKVVVVLDDVDRASGAIARMVRVWSEIAPSARFLLTSRKRVLAGKAHRIDVPPLPTSAGIKLFAARAGLKLDLSATKIVTAIVDALEGVPLAIELAASRAGALSLADIERLLTERLDLLEGGERSLRSAFALSWDELEEEDRATLAAFSTFRGGFDLAAASAVLERTEVRAARAIERLVDHSLLRPREDSGRHALDESLRAFARAQLAERKDEGEIRDRHARHFASLDDAEVDRLEIERSNLADALDFALEGGDGALAAALLRVSAPLYLARGPLGRFVDGIGRALATKKTPAKDRAELHLLRGVAFIFHGRRDEGVVDLRRARDLAKKAKNARVIALAASRMGLIVGFKGKLRAAETLFAEAAKAAARADDRTRGVVLKDRANVLAEHGKDEEAMAQLTRARALFHAAGDLREEGFVLLMLGMRLLDEGRIDDARRDLEAALGILRRAGDRRSEAWTTAMLGVTAAEAGDASGARTRLDASLAAVRAVGDEHTEGLVQSYRGNVAFEQGLLREAEEAYRTAITVLARAGDRGAEGAVTTALAAVEHELGRVSAAKEGFRRARLLARDDARAARREAFAILSSVIEGEAAMRRASAATGERESEEVRFARRIVARRLEGRRAPEANAGPGIVVAGDASWLRIASGATVRLGGARALARIVRELALERVRHPGRAASADHLVRVGWPDERIVPAAAKNRLHVTITRLRKLGLEDAIVREADGYMFDPAIDLTVSDV